MPEKYDSKERAALFLLMRENREVPNTELKSLGADLGPAGRNKLNKAGLLRTQTDKRPYVHRITDEGIAWCEEEIARIEAPPRLGAEARVMFEMVRCLVPLLKERGLRLIDVFRSGDLESLIRAVYLDLSVKPQDWVRLAKLRPRLNGADKSEVDEVLLKMVRTGTVHLAPDSNRKVLTDADHAAAVRIGNEDKHLVAIEES
jgi:hypothetical protein